MPPLRVALFVEGGLDPPDRCGVTPLERIWNGELAHAVGVRAFTVVVPISKKHLVAMDPENPPMSGAAEPLDALMARQLERHVFDAAVVAWDLIPAWNPTGEFCRFCETLDLYLGIARSAHLDPPWRDRARARYDDLRNRAGLGVPQTAPPLGRHQVVALCMEPMFDGLLAVDENALRRALGVSGKQVRGWPTGGFGDDPAVRRPDEQILGPAITAIRRMRPPPAMARTVRGDLRTNKNGWGHYLIRKLLADQAVRAKVLAHPICARLGKWVP